jgi:hypothetical protein
MNISPQAALMEDIVGGRGEAFLTLYLSPRDKKVTINLYRAAYCIKISTMPGKSRKVPPVLT